MERRGFSFAKIYQVDERKLRNPSQNHEEMGHLRSEKTRTMVEIAMLSAIAVVLMLFEFPLPFIAPPFYELDFSEVPVLIGAFALGPVSYTHLDVYKRQESEIPDS